MKTLIKKAAAWLTTLSVMGLVLMPSVSAKLSAEEKKPIVTVTTSFLEDMVQVLVGDLVQTELIIPAGGDPHLYEPKPGDLKKIAEADLLLYHGIHFEGKMTDVLEENHGVAVTEAFKPEEIGEFEEDGEKVQDPHFWFDPQLYKKATQRAAKALIELLPEHEKEIQEALKKYEGELDQLEKESKELIAEIPEKSRYLVTPHDAFSYFGRTYGIQPVAPQGVSTDSEVSNKDIEDTAQFIVDRGIKAIFAESSTNPKRMEKIQEVVRSKGADVKVLMSEEDQLFSDSLAPKGQPGDNYLDMVRHNVKTIVDHLK